MTTTFWQIFVHPSFKSHDFAIKVFLQISVKSKFIHIICQGLSCAYLISVQIAHILLVQFAHFLSFQLAHFTIVWFWSICWGSWVVLSFVMAIFAWFIEFLQRLKFAINFFDKYKSGCPAGGLRSLLKIAMGWDIYRSYTHHHHHHDKNTSSSTRHSKHKYNTDTNVKSDISKHTLLDLFWDLNLWMAWVYKHKHKHKYNTNV